MALGDQVLGVEDDESGSHEDDRESDAEREEQEYAESGASE
jgi:hypothetical protein